MLDSILQQVPVKQRLTTLALVCKEWNAAMCVSLQCPGLVDRQIVPVSAWLQKHAEQLTSVQLSGPNSSEHNLPALSVPLQFPTMPQLQVLDLQDMKLASPYPVQLADNAAVGSRESSSSSSRGNDSGKTDSKDGSGGSGTSEDSGSDDSGDSDSSSDIGSDSGDTDSSSDSGCGNRSLGVTLFPALQQLRLSGCRLHAAADLVQLAQSAITKLQLLKSQPAFDLTRAAQRWQGRQATAYQKRYSDSMDSAVASLLKQRHMSALEVLEVVSEVGWQPKDIHRKIAALPKLRELTLICEDSRDLDIEKLPSVRPGPGLLPVSITRLHVGLTALTGLTELSIEGCGLSRSLLPPYNPDGGSGRKVLKRGTDKVGCYMYWRLQYTPTYKEP